MANRSYLYACNEIPGESDTPEKNLIGLSECNYAIPLTYKILLSANPKLSRSRIWKLDKPIAIVGDFDAGVIALTNFLEKIKLTDAHPLITNTLVFLNKPENKAKYLLLESGEIFEMGDSELEEQNADLLRDIQHLHQSIEDMLDRINSPNVPPSTTLFGLFSRRSKSATPKQKTMRTVEELALNNWSNMLYFDFS